MEEGETINSIGSGRVGEFQREELKVMKKIFLILISFALTQGVMGLCFTDGVKGMTRGEIANEEGKDTGNTAVGAKYHAQGPSQFIRLTGPSSEKVNLPPPCSVIGITGKYIILEDFYGKKKTVEVEEFGSIKVGDKVVVKDGMLIKGISPK